MNPSRNLFLSFSSRDSLLVQRLSHALKHPEITLWDYSNPTQGLPLGGDLAAGLRERLAQADDVVVLISEASLDASDGRWVRFEIEVATQLGFVERGRLVPIVVDRAHLHKWEPPYSLLRDLMFIEVNPDDAQSFERAVSRLYQWLGLERALKTIADPRLPLINRLRDELERCRGALTVYTYNEFMRLAERVEVAYLRADYAVALTWIEALRYRLFDELRDTVLYYPDIVKGTCELHLDRTLDAARTFQTLVDHPAADESAWGGLGLCLLRMQRPADAAVAFEKALEHCPSDARVRYNLCLSQCMAGHRVSTDLFDLDLSIFEPEERVEMLCLMADVHCRQGRPAEAERLLRTLPSEHIHAVALMQLAQAVADQGRLSEAIRLLLACANEGSPVALWHLLAKLFFQHGDVYRALRVYENRLLAPPLATRQSRVEHAQVLWALGRRFEARRICSEILEGALFGLPSNAADFYWDGIANYICGHYERAHYDWLRSSGFGPRYEDLFAPDSLQFGGYTNVRTNGQLT